MQSFCQSWRKFDADFPEKITNFASRSLSNFGLCKGIPGLLPKYFLLFERPVPVFELDLEPLQPHSI